MGLFTRKPRPQPPRKPDVYVTSEDSLMLYSHSRTTRFFFKDSLMESSRWVESPDGPGMRSTGLTFLPNADAYRGLLAQLRTVIHQDEDQLVAKMDLTRCYPHYIALQWPVELQPEESMVSSEERIEREVTVILAEYFGWEQPVSVGRFRNDYDRYEIAKKLGVTWNAGSYR